ncbi:hypothetical protein EMIHUDRAFT_213885 [Emiliania huxleyi CCMP1516]|uniref:Uncharacterized protein n=2 Tax=Emiliania huxleyi TaxID=2903 RepID=A0A0D3ILH8_EMIH1|nr:hypothetical protein EMIHUDRAFT_213885 [Emiliania huxleyi CCMP1516]EOD12113.1 hypothetical protein EMIHUDRAFT_213885 [Emiliania huxleyi CCMP1516]|eukprot:XP_005764542.1 hypothetical protein EMIHUDRAFT_213885 [Emiliania huxleyi CCMP1516]
MTSLVTYEKLKSGSWLKACLFAPCCGLEGRTLYLDLDTVLVGDLRPLLRYSGPFATLSAAGFSAEEGPVFRCLMRWDHWLEMVVPTAHLVQDAFPGLVPHEAPEQWVARHWTEGDEDAETALEERTCQRSFSLGDA